MSGVEDFALRAWRHGIPQTEHLRHSPGVAGGCFFCIPRSAIARQFPACCPGEPRLTRQIGGAWVVGCLVRTTV